MSFAEIVILILLAYLLTNLASPIQKKIENILFRYFRSRGTKSSTIIDVTDSYKNKSEKEKSDGNG